MREQLSLLGGWSVAVGRVGPGGGRGPLYQALQPPTRHGDVPARGRRLNQICCQIEASFQSVCITVLDKGTSCVPDGAFGKSSADFGSGVPIRAPSREWWCGLEHPATVPLSLPAVIRASPGLTGTRRPALLTAAREFHLPGGKPLLALGPALSESDHGGHFCR